MGKIKEINIKNGSWFFDDTDENKELFRYDDVFNGIMDKIKKIDDDWPEYAKEYMKIKFSSDD